MASVTVKEAVTEVKVIEPKTITLTLSEEEATLLAALTVAVDGSSPDISLADSIYFALNRAGIVWAKTYNPISAIDADRRRES